MRICVNHGVGKDSELYLKGKDELIDLNEIYEKVIKTDKKWRLEIYEE